MAATSRPSNPLWRTIPQASGELYPWDSTSSYIKEPPFLDADLRKTVLKDISGARALAILGNSVTTDHISPIGSIKGTSPADSICASSASRNSISTITVRAA